MMLQVYPILFERYEDSRSRQNDLPVHDVAQIIG